MKAYTMTLALPALLIPAGFAAEAQPATTTKNPALEQTIHDYTIQHPEVTEVIVDITSPLRSPARA